MTNKSPQVSDRIRQPGPISETFSFGLRISEAASQDECAYGNDVASSLARREWRAQSVVLATVMALAGTYVALHLRNGWVPADEGTLGQSALRTLQGQLPHRDFIEIYTGGLSFIHAAAFRLFGVNLMSLRICIFLFFLAWVPTVYYIALRFTSLLGAGIVTLLAVSWSYPNYPAAMPSWYNLFFATFGAASLLRYLEVRKTRWLFVAGLCGGLSTLIKVIGAYYVAGVLLALAFVEQRSHESSKTRHRAIGYRVFAFGALGTFSAVLIYMFHARLSAGELYHFVFPPLALVGLVLLSDHGVSARTGERFRGLFQLVIPFVAGVLVPILSFLVPYARSGAIRSLFTGIASSAMSRSVALGIIHPISIDKSIYGMILVGVVAAAIYLREFQRKLISAMFGLGLLILVIKTTQPIALNVWFSIATLTPLVVLAGAVVLAIKKSERHANLQKEQVMVLISLAAMCSLVQYPFAAPIYLSYSIPLTFLAATAIVKRAKKQDGTYVLTALTVFLLVFAVLRVVPNYIYELTHKVGAMSELNLERAGGLRIELAEQMEDLIHFLQRHSPNGVMYTGNDCPELFFLSGLRNATNDDGGAAPTKVLRVLQSDDLKLVVINEAPFFPSGAIDPEVKLEVTKKFPESRRFGIFHVFWRQ